MGPSPLLVNFIKVLEGFKDTAYKPLSTDRWTIGYGSTYINGQAVQEGDTIDLDTASQVLKDTLEDVAKQIRSIGLPTGLTQSQFDAVISLVYNIGFYLFKTSDTGRLFYRGVDIGDRFALYNKSDGQVVQGLITRRARETAMYKNGTYN